MQFFRKTRQYLSEADPVYLCLFLALGLVFFLIAASGYSFYFLEHYAIIPPMLFWGILLTRKHGAAAIRSLMLGLAFSVWFVISQILQFADGLSVRSPGVFFLVYLMAFPFATASRDRDRQVGLKMTGIAYIGGALVLAGLFGLLSLNMLPEFLKPHVYWDGPRLRAMWHPNVCGCVFMIAMAFCLYFLSCCQRKVHKLLWSAAAGGMFFLAILTNSRTAILLCCCLAAGYLFFFFWNKSWKRLLLCVVGAVAVFAAIFLLYQGIFSLHTANMTQQAIANQDSQSISGTLKVDQETGEITLEADAAQKSLLEDVGTLNSRTKIWKAAIKAAQSNKSVLLRGTDDSASLIAQFYRAPVYTHNSFLETLLTMGIPGLLFSFGFALLALWRIARVLLCPTIPMSSKSIALLLTSLLGAAILEAYLFQGKKDFLYTEFVFCLCLGYLSPTKDC